MRIIKSKKAIKKRRKGATAVEFALVAPLLLLFVFSIFEISRLMLFDGNLNSALLVGVRQATFVESTQTEVDSTLRAELARFGIEPNSIQYDPPNFDADDVELQITLDASISSRFSSMHASGTKTIRFRRETR